MRVRIVCPAVKRSCGFKDATIFRGAFGDTQQRGSFYSHERRSRVHERRSMNLSLSPSFFLSLIKRLQSFVLDKEKKLSDHWRSLMCSKRTGTISVRKKRRTETVLFFCSAGIFLTAIASCTIHRCSFKQFEINDGKPWRR